MKRPAQKQLMMAVLPCKLCSWATLSLAQCMSQPARLVHFSAIMLAARGRLFSHYSAGRLGAGLQSHSLINTHFAFFIGNPDIALEKHIPSRFDHGKYALLVLRAHLHLYRPLRCVLCRLTLPVMSLIIPCVNQK